jgi:hypothetical protein
MSGDASNISDDYCLWQIFQPRPYCTMNAQQLPNCVFLAQQSAQQSLESIAHNFRNDQFAWPLLRASS